MLPVFGRGFRQHALNVCAARGAFHAEISFGAGTVSASGGIEMSEFVNVKSEIGRLRRVMLHRPGIELQNLMPDYLERMLAEDTPDVRRAGEEHDVLQAYFALTAWMSFISRICSKKLLKMMLCARHS